MQQTLPYKQRHANWQKGLLLFVLPIFILATSVIALFVLATSAEKVSAVASTTLNFQGRLLSNTGALVSDGGYDIEFNLYAAESGGSSLWTETHTSGGGNLISVQNGYFSVYLGDVTTGTPFPSTIPWGQELWLSMNVNGDGEMSPRFRLTAVPHAFSADALVDASGNALGASDFAQLSPASVQAVSAAVAALRLNQTGSGTLLQLQGDGSDVFTVNKTGAVGASGAISSGTASSAGGLTLQNGSGFGTTIQAAPTQSSGLTFVLPDSYGLANQCLIGDGAGGFSFTDCGTGGGGTAIGRTVVKTSDESVTSTGALQNDDELLFSIGANETWTFRFVLHGNSGTTPDFRFGVSAPVGATCSVGVIDAEGAVTNGNLGCGVSSGTIAGNNTDDVYEVVGTVTNGANQGNVTLQWGQFTSTATATIIRAGSSLFATSSGTSSTTFDQGGNDFGATAVLGTTTGYGLNIITNGAVAASFSATGETNVTNSLSIGTGLTVTSGGANLTGGVDNNSGGITEVGALSGVTSVASAAGLTVQSGGSSSITLDSANDILMLADSVLRRSASGITTIDLLDAGAGTTLSIMNSDATQIAGLEVEGTVTAAGFSGDGSGLTNLDGGAIATGTVGDARLSSNVVLLDQSQTFTGIPTFDSGLVLGNSTSTTAGAIRWSGSEFQGYDGVQWASLGGGGTILLADQSSFYAFDAAGDIDLTSGWTNITLDTEVKEDASFSHATDSEEIFFVDDGWYEITYDIGTYISTGTNRTSSRAKLQEDVGSGYIDVAGSESTMYNRNNANGYDSASATILRQFTAGDSIRLQAQAFNGTDTVLTEANTVRITIKRFTSSGGGGGGSGLEFTQGGNDFAATAVLGTTGNNDLNFITNGSTALSLTTSNQAIFSGELLANGGVVLGDDSTDGLTINSGTVSIANGLNFDSNTFVIDSTSDFIGINTAAPGNRLAVNMPLAADFSAQVLIATDGVTNKGLVIQGVASQSGNLFEVQNSAGTPLAGFNANGGLVLGASTLSSAASISRSVVLPDEAGTVCLSSSSSCGFLPYATGSFVTDGTNNDTIAINKTSAAGNLIVLQRSGGAVFTVANSGALQIQASSSTALDIRNTSGSSFFAVDTSTGRVRVGPSTADGVGVLFTLDTKNTSGDPTGIDGSLYYNSNLGKFRCYENGVWKDCIGTRQVRSFLDSTSDPVVDANTTNYWDTAVENNNTHPNITPTASGRSVTGSVVVEVSSATTADRSVQMRIERGIGSVPTCGSGTVVGAKVSTFTTNSPEEATSTVIFLDEPATTSQVFYTLCSDSATNNAGGMTISRIRFTLEEATNSN